MTAYDRKFYGDVKNLTRQKAIREFCVDCHGGVRQGQSSPKYCSDYGCPLWRYRLGTGTDLTFCRPKGAYEPGIDSEEV